MLTAKMVQGLVPDPKRPDRVVWDSRVPGFGCRVRASGVKAFVVVYRTRTTGEQRRLTLGSVDRLPLAQARDEARRVLAQVALGKDPARERTDSRRRGLTVKDLSERWLESLRSEGKRETTLGLYKWCLDAAILPAFGARPAHTLTAAHVREVYYKIRDAGHATKANRVLACLSSMLGWAARRDLLPSNVAAGAIHRADRGKERADDRRLSEAEASRFLQATRTLKAEGGHVGRIAAAFELALFAALRPTEVLRLKWSEIDETAGVIRFERQKAGSGVVHIRGPAAVLLASLDRTDPVYVFPSPMRKGQHVRDVRDVWERVRTLAAFDSAAAPKHLRKSFASLARAWGNGLEVISPALRHAEQTITGRAYAHADPAVVGKAAESIATKLAALANPPAKVVKLKK